MATDNELSGFVVDTITSRIGERMSEEVFGAIVKYVQTRCRVEETLIRYRNESFELSRRARELDAEWTRTGPHSQEQNRARQEIPRFESYVGEARKILTPSDERQSREIEEVRSLIQLLQGEGHLDPIPLLDQLYENDERRLTSDIAAMFELLEEARSYIDQSEAILKGSVGRRSPSRFWKS
jgi:hypothetical protein